MLSNILNFVEKIMNNSFIFKRISLYALILSAVVIFYCSLILACLPGPIITYTRDISGEGRLWNGYKYKEIYTLKHDIFLMEESLPMKFFALVPPSKLTKGVYTLSFDSPSTIDEYNSFYNNWPTIKGIVEKGTHIQCIKLIEYVPIGFENSLYIYAKILNGPFLNTEVEISDLSLVGLEDKSGLFLLKPNYDLLRKNKIE